MTDILTKTEQSNAQKIWVVFSGHADLAWLKILKRGFRHCSLLLCDEGRWISYDPLSNYTDIMIHQVPEGFDFPRWMQERGHIVLSVTRACPKKPAPLEFLSCVSAIKRVLGVHERFIFTPWQLYRYLCKQNQHQSHSH